MKCIKTYSVEQTVEVGVKLGRILNKGDIVCLTGDLGTGKTALTQGIASALGIKGYVTSPTFTIVNEYRGSLPLYHFDVYRLTSPDEMYEIGFEEYLDGSGVVVMEWADRIREILPDEYIRIDIRKNTAEGIDIREICIEFKGMKYKEYEEQLRVESVKWGVEGEE